MSKRIVLTPRGASRAPVATCKSTVMMVSLEELWHIQSQGDCFLLELF